MPLEDSIFIHRLALIRSESGKGLGKKIINWIDQGIQLPKNKHFLKLDCVSDNKKLNDYYIANGFEYLGSTEDRFCKYQKEIMRDLHEDNKL